MVNSLVLSCLSFALRGDQETAVRLGRRALDMADELGNPSTVAWAEFGLGSALHVSGDLASAEAHLGASLHRARSVGNQWVLGLGLGQFASVRRLTAGPRDALPSMVESLELWGRAGNRVQLGHDLRLAALCAGSAGETATCLRVEAAAQAVGASLPLLARESAELVELLAAAERIHPDLPRDRLAIEARAAGWKAATSAAIAELRKVVSGEIVADDDAARAPRP